MRDKWKQEPHVMWAIYGLIVTEPGAQVFLYMLDLWTDRHSGLFTSLRAGKGYSVIEHVTSFSSSHKTTNPRYLQSLQIRHAISVLGDLISNLQPAFERAPNKSPAIIPYSPSYSTDFSKQISHIFTSVSFAGRNLAYRPLCHMIQWLSYQVMF